MVILEKLSLFNINAFKKLYNKKQNSYICDESFFEVYNNEPFMIKYVMRKQVRLFKKGSEYIGYLWYEYPEQDGFSDIYSLDVKDEYVNMIDFKILDVIKIKHLKFDIIDTLKIKTIMNKLQFSPRSETILMKMNTLDYESSKENEKYIFRHFKKNQDEKLRCDIQNSVFNDKDRIPLTIGDIQVEEDEDYYLDDFGVFIYTKERIPVGYGQLIYSKCKYTIVNLGVIAEYRGYGIGEELVRYLISLCKKRHIDIINIRVEIKNYKAISLYKKVGFKEYNSLTTWYKNI